jgi:hypothetical protein
MSRNIVLELFLIVSVALVWIPGTSALPQYLDAYNTTFSTNASCGICHDNPAGGGTLNPYGMQFQNQTNHATNPSSALKAIGQAPVIITPAATIATTSMVTAISTATPVATAPTLITTPMPTPTPTPSTSGFGLGVFIAGLLACYFILKRHNN